jgi:hypothetical protein
MFEGGSTASDEKTALAVSWPERREDAPGDLVEQWGLDSFPASDPPANW